MAFPTNTSRLRVGTYRDKNGAPSKRRCEVCTIGWLGSALPPNGQSLSTSRQPFRVRLRSLLVGAALDSAGLEVAIHNFEGTNRSNRLAGIRGNPGTSEPSWTWSVRRR